jgi:hypothetical protein
MLHVVKQIERRFPNSGGRIVGGLLVLSVATLAVGLWLIFGTG